MNQAGGFTDPGQGLLDFARIFRHSDRPGSANTSSNATTPAAHPEQPADALDTARVGYQFLRTVRF